MKPHLQPDSDIDDTTDLLGRFQKQLDKVEHLMNASMRPLISQKSPLSDKGVRQALETLERWAELYRNGLKAAGNISQRGAEWLYEAHQRLGLTAEVLQRLDIKSERLATKTRADKAKYILKNIHKIEHIITPIVDQLIISK